MVRCGCTTRRLVMDARYSLTRRHFVQGAGLASFGLLAGCGLLAQPAQRPARVPRIGFLQTDSNPLAASFNEAFRQGLRELGYFEGQNVLIEWRAADSDGEGLPELAAEL